MFLSAKQVLAQTQQAVADKDHNTFLMIDEAIMYAADNGLTHVTLYLPESSLRKHIEQLRSQGFEVTVDKGFSCEKITIDWSRPK